MPPPDQPLALVARHRGAHIITAANGPAQKWGIGPSKPLTDAQALCPTLLVRDANPQADRAALATLALWCNRYTPWAAEDLTSNTAEPDGLLLDISGCAHLFGGEAELAADLITRFRQMGLTAHTGLAANAGTAWAVARFGQINAGLTGNRLAGQAIVAGGDEERMLAPLPVEALRLTDKGIVMLRRLGLETIGDLLPLPRAPLTARFGEMIARRLDQVRGLLPEPISPRQPVATLRTLLHLAEPLVRMEDVETAIERLTQDLCPLLEKDGTGARRLELMLFRVDGEITRLDVGTSRPMRDPRHLARLFREKLAQAKDDFDAGYGMETLSLAAIETGPLTPCQIGIEQDHEKQAQSLDLLIDRMGNRLGSNRILKIKPRESHMPERAAIRVPVLSAPEGGAAHDQPIWPTEHYHRLGRPLRLFARAEPVEVVAEVPEGPPRQFRWRRVLHQIIRAEGPERLAPEWWRDSQGRTRDYYKVEDMEGHRFWLYREGLYNRDSSPPTWFIHGQFG